MIRVEDAYCSLGIGAKEDEYLELIKSNYSEELYNKFLTFYNGLSNKNKELIRLMTPESLFSTDDNKEPRFMIYFTAYEPENIKSLIINFHDVLKS